MYDGPVCTRGVGTKRGGGGGVGGSADGCAAASGCAAEDDPVKEGKGKGKAAGAANGGGGGISGVGGSGHGVDGSGGGNGDDGSVCGASRAPPPPTRFAAAKADGCRDGLRPSVGSRPIMRHTDAAAPMNSSYVPDRCPLGTQVLRVAEVAICSVVSVPSSLRSWVRHRLTELPRQVSGLAPHFGG